MPCANLEKLGSELHALQAAPAQADEAPHSTWPPAAAAACLVFGHVVCRHGFWVYDFALPMLLLHALRFRTAESLKHW